MEICNTTTGGPGHRECRTRSGLRPCPSALVSGERGGPTLPISVARLHRGRAKRHRPLIATSERGKLGNERRRGDAGGASGGWERERPGEFQMNRSVMRSSHSRASGLSRYFNPARIPREGLDRGTSAGYRICRASAPDPPGIAGCCCVWTA
ncbi:hypothetical protein AAFF_G00058630 [Aldrovandia affinis]|uniref:Uncharacterized protein n=1 Tax=Aldrovandia affinis TaxID=143900 RepID=A0AAD7WF46_9TELE|nr:hypothetical protein AAFF_G00058630 [Aldrovandia affinis]